MFRNKHPHFKEIKEDLDYVSPIKEAISTNSKIVNVTDSITTLAILDKIRHLPQVQEVATNIETITKNKRHLRYTVFFEDSTKAIYIVHVGEDNGMSVSTHFNFRVDAKTLKILNFDGKY